MLKGFINNNLTLQNDEYLQDGLIMCKKCRTARMFVSPDGSVKTRCLCECQSNERDKLLEEKRLAKIEERRKQIKDLCIRHKKWQNFTIAESEETKSQAYKVAVGYIKDFERHKIGGTGIIFYGEKGAGKTYYSSAISNAVFDKGYFVYMVNASELMSVFDSGKSDDINQEIQRISRADLFVLDDLGAERSSEYAQGKIYQVINTRVLSGKPMVISTNVTSEQISAEKSGILRRTYDRIFEVCYPVLMTGNWRKVNAKKNFEMFKSY